MANICEYKVLVMGAKNACYAFFGSMSAYDKCIVEEKGTDSKYELIFEGNCKWGVDAYCEKPWAEAVPVSLPADAQEALRLAEEKYAYYSVQERSRMFGVTVYCNSADIDEGEEIIYECYSCGEKLEEPCPAPLSFADDEKEKEVEAEPVQAEAPKKANVKRVHGVSEGGRRVLFDENITIFIPDGAYYTLEKEKGKVTTITVPSVRPEGYCDGEFDICVEENDFPKVNITSSSQTFNVSYFTELKDNLLSMMRDQPEMKDGKVLYCDRNCIVSCVKIARNESIHNKETGKTERHTFTVFGGSASTHKGTYTMNCSVGGSPNNAVEEEIMASVRCTKGKTPEKLIAERLAYGFDEAKAKAKDRKNKRIPDDMRSILLPLLEKMHAETVEQLAQLAAELKAESFFRFAAKKVLNNQIAAAEFKLEHTDAAIKCCKSLGEDAAVMLSVYVADQTHAWSMVDFEKRPSLRPSYRYSGEDAFMELADLLSEIGIMTCTAPNAEHSPWSNYDSYSPKRNVEYKFNVALNYQPAEVSQDDIEDEKLRLLHYVMGGDDRKNITEIKAELTDLFTEYPGADTFPGKQRRFTDKETSFMSDRVYSYISMHQPCAEYEIIKGLNLTGDEVRLARTVIGRMSRMHTIVRTGSGFKL